MIMSFDSSGFIEAKCKENTAHAFDVLQACVFVCLTAHAFDVLQACVSLSLLR